MTLALVSGLLQSDRHCQNTERPPIRPLLLKTHIKSFSIKLAQWVSFAGVLSLQVEWFSLGFLPVVNGTNSIAYTPNNTSLIINYRKLHSIVSHSFY